jgi:imidazole glycerol-phosphate synthase subunit HisH
VIVIVDYGMGNLGSMLNMLKKAGVRAVISSDPADVSAASRLILPGVGAFDAGMRNLRERGLVPALTRRVIEEGTPILGVCLGLQLFTEGSEEGGEPGLGWLEARTVRFRREDLGPELRVPHMGWNQVRPTRSHPLLQTLPSDARFYFVHSYHLECAAPGDVLATTRHGYDFASIVARGNLMGTQFHPEKSHRYGMALLKCFAEGALVSLPAREAVS